MARISHEDIQNKKVNNKKYYNVQQLRTEIRQLTKQANAVLLQNEDRADYRQLADRLIEAARVERLNKKGEVIKPKNPGMFVGDLNFKNVEQLEIQLQGLQQFLEYDTLSDEAKRKQQERFRKAKEKFESNYGKVTEAEFEKLVQTYTIVGNISEKYGSDNIREIAETAKEQGISINITSSFEKAEKYLKDNDMLQTPENVIDAVYAMNGIKRTE